MGWLVTRQACCVHQAVAECRTLAQTVPAAWATMQGCQVRALLLHSHSWQRKHADTVSTWPSQCCPCCMHPQHLPLHCLYHAAGRGRPSNDQSLEGVQVGHLVRGCMLQQPQHHRRHHGTHINLHSWQHRYRCGGKTQKDVVGGCWQAGELSSGDEPSTQVHYTVHGPVCNKGKRCSTTSC